jgi:hypothetical protein
MYRHIFYMKKERRNSYLHVREAVYALLEEGRLEALERKVEAKLLVGLVRRSVDGEHSWAP